CPVEVKMMREVRTIEPQSKSLEGYLEAFTFTGSSMLELEAEVETCLEHCKCQTEAEVETCLEHCKPVVCQIPTGRREDDTETVFSFGRKKRESGSEEVLSSVTLSRSVAIQADDFASVKSLVPENYASPVTAPSPLAVKTHVFRIHERASPTHVSIPDAFSYFWPGRTNAAFDTQTGWILNALDRTNPHRFLVITIGLGVERSKLRGLERS
ncbi:hypothetical protein AVEN_55758-1, partial [Araneus ventricosus]